MIESIREAFKNKSFTIVFLFCFILSTPIFVKILLEDFQSGNLDIVRSISIILQYGFCIIIIPKHFARYFNR